MSMHRRRFVKEEKKKKNRSDPLSPAKKSHFSVASMTAVSPGDPNSDLYWDSPTSRSSSQFVAQLVKEKNEEARREEMKKLSPEQKRIMQATSPVRKVKPAALLLNKSPKFVPGEFSSKQPDMTYEEQEEYYAKTYPFNYLTLEDFNTTAESIERVYKIEELTGKSANSEKSRTMEAIVLYCRFLEDTVHIHLGDCIFVDLMGCGGESCLYASAFHFDRIIDIELTEASRKAANDAISAIAGLDRMCSVLVGTFRDYFPFDAQVYYMDCSWVVDGHSIVDEGTLINMCFKLCKRIKSPQAYLAMMTITTSINPTRDFLAPHMKTMMRTHIHFGLPDEVTCWIFQIKVHEELMIDAASQGN